MSLVDNRFSCLFGRYGSTCNTYIFSSDNDDPLTFTTPFTGNFKLIYAGTDEVGMPAAIVAGRTESSFTPSTDLLNDPQWNYYEIEAASLSTMIEVTANGRVGHFYLDGVECSVDMGALSQDFAWTEQYLWSA